jgi:Phage capsid family
MTAHVRELAPWLAAVLPGLRGARLMTPAAAEMPPALRAATITTPANPVATGTAPALFGGLSGPTFRRTLPDLMASIPMSGGVLSVPQLNRGANGAAPHAEGQPKREGDLTFAGVTAKAATVATFVAITDELLDDVAGLEAWLHAYLGYLVKLAEESEILFGTGVAPNHIKGFFNSGCPAYGGAETEPAAIVADMIAQAVRTNGIYPDTAVLSSALWAGLAASDAAGLDAAAGTFAGVDVITSGAMSSVQAMVGPVQALAVLGREGGTIVEGTRSHASDFISNKAAIRAASRLALGILMPSSFVIKNA